MENYQKHAAKNEILKLLSLSVCLSAALVGGFHLKTDKEQKAAKIQKSLDHLLLDLEIEDKKRGFPGKFGYCIVPGNLYPRYDNLYRGHMELLSVEKDIDTSSLIFQNNEMFTAKINLSKKIDIIFLSFKAPNYKTFDGIQFSEFYLDVGLRLILKNGESGKFLDSGILSRSAILAVAQIDLSKNQPLLQAVPVKADEIDAPLLAFPWKKIIESAKKKPVFQPS